MREQSFILLVDRINAWTEDSYSFEKFLLQIINLPDINFISASKNLNQNKNQILTLFCC